MKELKLYIGMFFVGATITAIGFFFMNQSPNLITVSVVTSGGILAVIGRYLYQMKNVELGAKKHQEVKGGQEKIIKEITGGESYPKFIFINNIINSSIYDISLLVQGNKPLYDLSYEIIDEIAAKEVLNGFGQSNINGLNPVQRQRYFSALHPAAKRNKTNYNPNGFTNPAGQIQFPNNKNEYELCIMTWARNGSFFQRTKFKKDNKGIWKTESNRISKMNRDPNKPGTSLEKFP
mgnify:CR=1 FL=1